MSDLERKDWNEEGFFYNTIDSSGNIIQLWCCVSILSISSLIIYVIDKDNTCQLSTNSFISLSTFLLIESIIYLIMPFFSLFSLWCVWYRCYKKCNISSSIITIPSVIVQICAAIFIIVLEIIGWIIYSSSTTQSFLMEIKELIIPLKNCACGKVENT